MSDIGKLREDFEAAFVKETASKASQEKIEVFEVHGGFESILREVMIDDRKGDSYSTNVYAAAWWAWQASRQAVVVGLPSKGEPFYVADIKSFSLHNEGRNKALDECCAAIEAAGLRCEVRS